jgi:hypothetical protein
MDGRGISGSLCLSARSAPRCRVSLPAKGSIISSILAMASGDLHTAIVARNMICGRNRPPIMVVVPLPAIDPGRTSDVYLRSGIVNAHSRRSSDGSALPVMDRILIRCVPRTHPLVRKETKSWIGTFKTRITRAIFAFGRVKVRKAPNIPIATDRDGP